MAITRLAILGTGGMANHHAETLANIKGIRIVACCDIRESAARTFSEKFNIPEYYTDLKKMLKHETLDGIINVTIDAVHCSTTLQILKHGGIHVLCEKPLATHAADANKMVKAAKKASVINMVNLSYRASPALQRAQKLIAAGKIGEIVHFEASYLQSWLTSKAWGDWKTGDQWLWRLSKSHGSKGVLGDVGVHILDFALFPAGEMKTVNCRLKTFPKAKGNRMGKYKLDANDSAIITAELKNGAIGTIHTTRLATGHTNSLRLKIHGRKGALMIDLDESISDLNVCYGEAIHKAKWTVIKCGKTPNNLKRFIQSIKSGVQDQPDFARGAVIQKTLDACFKSNETGKTVTV